MRLQHRRRDMWLSAELPKIMASQAYKTGRDLPDLG